MKPRYLVSTIRTITVHAEARAKGWDEDDANAGPLDYLDVPESYAVHKPFDAFGEAVEDARRKIEGDFFRNPRIYEEHWNEEGECWESVSFWEIEEGIPVHEDRPTYVYEEESTE